MNIEDVVLLTTVREDIRHHALHVDSNEIPRCVEAAQAVMHAVTTGHGAFASEGAKGVSPTHPSPSNGTTERGAGSTAPAAAANYMGAEGENEDDAKTAVAASPVDVRRGVNGRDNEGFSFFTIPSEARSAAVATERSSRPSSAWGKILVVPSPTVSHPPQPLTWRPTFDPTQCFNPPARSMPGKPVCHNADSNSD